MPIGSWTKPSRSAIRPMAPAASSATLVDRGRLDRTAAPATRTAPAPAGSARSGQKGRHGREDGQERDRLGHGHDAHGRPDQPGWAGGDPAGPDERHRREQDRGAEDQGFQRASAGKHDHRTPASAAEAPDSRRLDSEPVRRAVTSAASAARAARPRGRR